MDDFNNPYAFQRSPSNGDDMITLRNKPIEGNVSTETNQYKFV